MRKTQAMRTGVITHGSDGSESVSSINLRGNSINTL